LVECSIGYKIKNEAAILVQVANMKAKPVLSILISLTFNTISAIIIEQIAKKTYSFSNETLKF
jgi:hypothetical protein